MDDKQDRKIFQKGWVSNTWAGCAILVILMGTVSYVIACVIFTVKCNPDPPVQLLSGQAVFENYVDGIIEDVNHLKDVRKVWGPVHGRGAFAVDTRIIRLRGFPLKLFACKEEGAKGLELELLPGDRIRLFYKPLVSLQELFFTGSAQPLSGKARLLLTMADGNPMETVGIWREQNGCWSPKYVVFWIRETKTVAAK